MDRAGDEMGLDDSWLDESYERVWDNIDNTIDYLLYYLDSITHALPSVQANKCGITPFRSSRTDNSVQLSNDLRAPSTMLRLSGASYVDADKENMVYGSSSPTDEMLPLDFQIVQSSHQLTDYMTKGYDPELTYSAIDTLPTESSLTVYQATTTLTERFPSARTAVDLAGDIVEMLNELRYSMTGTLDDESLECESGFHSGVSRAAQLPEAFVRDDRNSLYDTRPLEDEGSEKLVPPPVPSLEAFISSAADENDVSVSGLQDVFMTPRTETWVVEKGVHDVDELASGYEAAAGLVQTSSDITEEHLSPIDRATLQTPPLATDAGSDQRTLSSSFESFDADTKNLAWMEMNCIHPSLSSLGATTKFPTSNFDFFVPHGTPFSASSRLSRSNAIMRHCDVRLHKGNRHAVEKYKIKRGNSYRVKRSRKGPKSHSVLFHRENAVLRPKRQSYKGNVLPSSS